LMSGKRLIDFPPMPLSTGPQEGEVWGTMPANFLLAQQLRYDIHQLKATVEHNCGRFNAEQRNVFDAAMDSVDNNKGKNVVHTQCRWLWKDLCLQCYCCCSSS
jgi:hypothetical protein